MKTVHHLPSLVNPTAVLISFLIGMLVHATVFRPLPAAHADFGAGTGGDHQLLDRLVRVQEQQLQAMRDLVSATKERCR
jgi:hypothetical protein